MPGSALRATAVAAALLAPLVGLAAGTPPASALPVPAAPVPATRVPGRAAGLHLAAAGPAVIARVQGRKVVLPLAGGRSARPRNAAIAPGHAGTESHTVTVTGTNLAGKPVNGDVVYLDNVDHPGAPGTGLAELQHGTATFTVPPGTYWAVGMFAQFSSSGRITAARMDVLPQFTVSRDRTLRMSSRDATDKVTITTPRRAIPRSATLTVVRAAPHSPATGPSARASSMGLTALNVPLWVSPVSHAPGHGGLRAFTSAQLTSPPGPGTPYGYTLNFVNPPGTIASQHFTVHPAGLATITERYVQDRKSAGAWQTLGGTRYQMQTSTVGALDLPLRLPGRLIQYVSAQPAMFWSSEYLEFDRLFPGQTTGGQTSAIRLLHAGEHLSRTWNRYPLHPGPNVVFPGTAPVTLARASADRAGNMLNLDLTPFSGNQAGDTGSGLVVEFPGKVSQVRGNYAVYQNGVKIASGDAVKSTGGFGDVQVATLLSAKPSVIKFVLAASRASKQYLFSATSRDAWTWHTRRQPRATLPPPWLCGFSSLTAQPDNKCAVQPMMTVNYQVAGLSLAGRARPGRQVIGLDVGHIQLAPAARISRAGLAASFDAGKTWHPARVTRVSGGRFRAVFTAPAGALVMLRASAADAAGGSITETITGAYRTSP